MYLFLIISTVNYFFNIYSVYICLLLFNFFIHYAIYKAVDQIV